MSSKLPFPFFHRLIVLLFAGGIVAIGGKELVQHPGSLGETLAKALAGFSLPSVDDLRREATNAPPQLVPWDEQTGAGVRAQFSAARSAAKVLQPSDLSEGAEREPAVAVVDEETDALARNDRRELESLLTKVTK